MLRDSSCDGEEEEEEVMNYHYGLAMGAKGNLSGKGPEPGYMGRRSDQMHVQSQ